MNLQSYIQLKQYIFRLLDRVQSEDPTWKDSGTAFITSVTRLLERLLDYRSVIQGDENRDKRMSCTVNLLVTNVSIVYIVQRMHKSKCINVLYKVKKRYQLVLIQCVNFIISLDANCFKNR
jgi:hypothetical protein